MNRAFIESSFSILIMLAFVPLSGGSLGEKSNETLILAGNYWDGLADGPLGPAEVLIIDGKIAKVGKNVTHNEAAKVIDLSGMFLMPGFIDSHVHLTINPDVIAALPTYSDAALTLAGINACKILLHNGFTTVRDAGDLSINSWVVPELKKAVASGSIRGPRIICGGHMISALGGHFDFGGMLRAGAALDQVSVAEGVDGVRRAVHNEVRHGADWIKVAGSGGFLSPSDGPEDASYSQEEMNAIVNASTDLGKPVFVHAYGDEPVHRAAAAKVRSIEHASMASVQTLKMIAENGIYVVPTQMALVPVARDAVNGTFDPKEPEWARQKDLKYAPQILESSRNLAKSDVKIALGTDVGTFDYSKNGAAEFSEMVRNGIAPLRALKAGTSMAAEMLQLNDTGIIALGKRADLVALAGNPFENMSATENVRLVMKEGVVYRNDVK
ncbi:MAG: isoaspartyl dipeptidase [Methanosaeta sp. PtaU1.Bin112]|nr:MAG: isoaspartyl dipeptidase [Methanosaeta sp. PtaU1.Bin112]